MPPGGGCFAFMAYARLGEEHQASDDRFGDPPGGRQVLITRQPQL